MKVYDAAGIRNVAVVGHSGAGKTQLASAHALRRRRGQPVRQGRRRHNGDRLRRRRDRPQAHALRRLATPSGTKPRSTSSTRPGMGNFLCDARSALRVAEAALIVVDAVAGVEVSTEKVWEEADELGLPRIDRRQPPGSRARESRTRARIDARACCGRNCIPMQLPIGEERAFTRRRRSRRDESVHVRRRRRGKLTEAAVPDAQAAAADRARER